MESLLLNDVRAITGNRSLTEGEAIIYVYNHYIPFVLYHRYLAKMEELKKQLKEQKKKTPIKKHNYYYKKQIS